MLLQIQIPLQISNMGTFTSINHIVEEGYKIRHKRQE